MPLLQHRNTCNTFSSFYIQTPLVHHPQIRAGDADELDGAAPIKSAAASAGFFAAASETRLKQGLADGAEPAYAVLGAMRILFCQVVMRARRHRDQRQLPGRTAAAGPSPSSLCSVLYAPPRRCGSQRCGTCSGCWAPRHRRVDAAQMHLEHRHMLTDVGHAGLAHD